MTVVDASIVVRLLTNRPGDDALRDRFRTHRRLHAPALIDAEVLSAIRGLLMAAKRSVRINTSRAGQMLDDYADLPLSTYSMSPLQRRALELRDNFTAYDAMYVALAEDLVMPLLTCDTKFAAAPATHTATIETWH